MTIKWCGRALPLVVLATGLCLPRDARADLPPFKLTPLRLTTDEPVRWEEPKLLATFADSRRWTVETLATGLGDVTNRHVQMGGATVGVGYYVLDNLAILFDVTGYGFSEGRSTGAAVGGTLGLRHHLLDFGRGSSLFVDVSGGVIELSNNVPYGGTHFNDTFEVGPGVAYPLNDHFFLVGGVRYFHMSNAQREGAYRNPSVNAVQGVVGVMWKF